MTKAKRFVRCFIAISLALLLFVAAAVFIFDPLYQYHLPWFGLGMPLFLERYQNAGLVRQLDFNAVLLGSSMVQNCRASWFDEALGAKTLKLTYSSGYLPQYGMTLDLIYSLQSLDYVFLNLDIYTLRDGSDYTYYENPPYLYDNNRWNDVNYLLNRDVLMDVFPRYVQHQGDDAPLEDAFAYEDRAVFGREIVLGAHRVWLDSHPQKAAKEPSDAYYEALASSLAKITGFIEAHPETEYYVFLPPYSILDWAQYVRLGQADAVLGATGEAARILLGYDNVRFFCFMGAEDIITDLDRYFDTVHYDRRTCEELVARMLAGDCEITSDNRAAFMEALSAFVWNYDYEALFDSPSEQPGPLGG